MQKTLLPPMLALFCMVGVLINPVFAQNTILVTPDVATDDPDASGTVFRTWDVLAYHSPDYEPIAVISFPAKTVIDALHKMDALDEWLISVDVATELPPTSGVVFQAEDVIHYDGSNYTMYFDGSANGVPPGVDVDAVFLIGGDSGDLVISFDIVTTIDTTTYESSDLVRFSAGTFSAHFDASAAGSGVPRSGNLIGADDDAGGVVLAFGSATDLASSTGPTTYTRGDLAQWDGASYGLFDSLAGWPASSKINAMFCCPDGDADIICTAVDNCPNTVNPGQEDADSDTQGDACDPCPYDPVDDADSDGFCADLDNCPNISNADQADADSDNMGDICDDCPADPANDADSDNYCADVDCDSVDGDIWEIPGEVLALQLSHTGGELGSTALSWSIPSAPGGTSLAYDVVSSSSAGDFGSTADCLESNDGMDTEATDDVPVSSGQSRFYLVRAENDCGEGSAGESTGGLRAVRGCPELRRRAFVSSQTYNGDLGGLAGADAICQSLASAAGLPGTYMAWLSGIGDSPATRFTQSLGAYAMVDGTVIANNWADLTDGTLRNPLLRDEFGNQQTVENRVWTSTDADGTSIGGPWTCRNWTESKENCGQCQGYLGLDDQTDASWSYSTTATCNSLLHLYCFEQ